MWRGRDWGCGAEYLQCGGGLGIGNVFGARMAGWVRGKLIAEVLGERGCRVHWGFLLALAWFLGQLVG